ncbi:hypothetical protein CEXT_516811 [Caerostris extrusa]|uniref:Uncharacterized protein n=1 Tax=Caerostris extrusa TaxID=172846 RepID=A0AAV4MS09_CAEEX|nr:hypothetical protein CEXT_516811 [Caerostris extrusa]
MTLDVNEKEKYSTENPELLLESMPLLAAFRPQNPAGDKNVQLHVHQLLSPWAEDRVVRRLGQVGTVHCEQISGHGSQHIADSAHLSTKSIGHGERSGDKTVNLSTGGEREMVRQIHGFEKAKAHSAHRVFVLFEEILHVRTDLNVIE